MPDESLSASWRPFVLLNVAESADGKIAPVERGKLSFGSADDRAQMELLRSQADGVLIGGGTLHMEDPSLVIRNADLQADRLKVKGSAHPLNMAVCTRIGADAPQMNFFQNPETEKVLFTTSQTAPEVIDAIGKRARVEIVPVTAAGRVDLVEVVRRLPALGVQRLLLEGGGELNFSMLKEGLVDEVYLTVCPFIFGGRGAPTGVDGDGFSRDQIRKLRLISHRVSRTGEILLHYSVLPQPATVNPSRLFPNGFELS